MPTVGLFVPCFVDQLQPRVGVATLRLLQRHGVKVEFPPEQTCCGQPMANSGCRAEAAPLAERFLRIFSRYDHVVAPSGSCVSMVRHHYDGFLAGRDGFDRLKANTFELCEYLHDVVGVREAGARFPRVVGLHRACHGLRELRLGSGSERRVPPFDKVKTLLDSVEGIRVVEPARPDECCGFGGTFAVNEEAVSCMMGKDKLADLAQAGAEVVTSADGSCLMHLEGLARRAGSKLEFMHVAEVLLGER